MEGEDFYIDLLLVHVPTNRFVVEELKSGKFRPEHLGQLNFYVSAVNDLVKFHGMAPTVGILVCGSKHDPTVRYASARVWSYCAPAQSADGETATPSPSPSTTTM